jgi:hypothetical protein
LQLATDLREAAGVHHRTILAAELERLRKDLDDPDLTPRQAEDLQARRMMLAVMHRLVVPEAVDG